MSTQLFDSCCQIIGPGIAIHWKEEIQLLSDALYFGLSIIPGRQTLGEEFCDIIQVDGSRLTPPLIWERVVFLLVHLLLPYIYTKGVNYLTRLSRTDTLISLNPNQHNDNWDIPESTKKLLQKLLPQITSFLNILGRVHIAVFYFTGNFYEFSKRLVNIKYIFNRNYSEERERFTILGVLIFLQLGITSFIFLKNAIRPSKPDHSLPAQETKINDYNNNDTGVCSLCLEVRRNPTATPCGHLFCWECIVKWCNNKSECPLDRMPIKKNQLVCVYGL
uniref:RING-type E3 ubiquitin transferase n=1 Tax=Arcella intermedia TaxID=1963864 RepID=A0A6B2LCA1_9EUKA